MNRSKQLMSMALGAIFGTAVAATAVIAHEGHHDGKRHGAHEKAGHHEDGKNHRFEHAKAGEPPAEQKIEMLRARVEVLHERLEEKVEE